MRGPLFGAGEPIPRLPSRAEEFLAAWRCSWRELGKERIDPIAAAYERGLILKEADEAGVLDEVVRLIQKDPDDSDPECDPEPPLPGEEPWACGAAQAGGLGPE